MTDEKTLNELEAAGLVGELYREGTRVYSNGALVVDTYSGAHSIKQSEVLAELICNVPELVTDSRKLAAVQWQPIETSPKATDVLVFSPDRGGRDSKCVVARSDGGKFWITVPGAWELRPTHWMPLPEPPSIDQPTGGPS